MTMKRTPRPRDPIQLGKLMLDIATGAVPDAVDDGKDAAAADRGKLGGDARAYALDAQRRKQIAAKAGATRWGKGRVDPAKKEPV